MMTNRISRWVAFVMILAVILTGCVAPATPVPVGGEPVTPQIEPTVTEVTVVVETSTELPVTEAPAAAPAEAPTEAPAATSPTMDMGLVLGPEYPYFKEIEIGAQTAANALDVSLSTFYGDDPSDQVSMGLDWLMANPDGTTLVFPLDPTVIEQVQAASGTDRPFFALGDSWSTPPTGKVVSFINDSLPPNPQALGYAAVQTAYRHVVDGEQVEEVVQVGPPDVNLPVTGTIILPPTGPQRVDAAKELEAQMKESGIDPGNYATGAVVIYPDPKDAKGAQFSAAPIFQFFENFPYGIPTMVLLDRDGSLCGTPSVTYEVTFYDNKTAELTNPNGDKCEPLPASFADQEEFAAYTSTFFVEGSCYLCVYPDKVVACLVCTSD